MKQAGVKERTYFGENMGDLSRGLLKKLLNSPAWSATTKKKD